MTLRLRLLDLLSDGNFRSGQWLGSQLGVSRAAVWKHVRALAELGLDVQAVHGKGYRLAHPLAPLRRGAILRALSPAALARVDSLDVLQEIDSTSNFLKRSSLTCRSDVSRICVAEHQTAGRGRRGRQWVSPYGSSLYLSFTRQVDGAGLHNGGLSLVVALAVLRALRQLGVDRLAIKWPNDILYAGRKLAGILLDISGESAGPYALVIGVGINVNLPASAASEIDRPWADLSQCGRSADRNELAARIFETSMVVLDQFMREGLTPFAAEWQCYDAIAGREVELQLDRDNRIRGLANGIDGQGALVLDRDGVLQCFHAGEVSVRVKE